MKYNFDKVINRRNTECIKWDYVGQVFGAEDILPMWVADMDFECPECITEALKARVSHGIYAYTGIPEALYKAVIDWMKKRHGWEIKKEWICFTPGVVPAISMAISAFTHSGDKVIVQSPVYHPFFSVIKNNGCHVADNPLKFENGKYVMDFEALDKTFDSRTKVMLLCSPHNPVGRVWTKAELELAAEKCLKHNAVIISDEIHSDLIFKGNKHVPIASISEDIAQNTITCVAPSKTFNIAGLEFSLAIIPNKKLRNEFINKMNTICVSASSVFGVTAAQAAYTSGEEWLEELLEYLDENAAYMDKFLRDKLPVLKMVKPEGTYLGWLDCRQLGMSQQELADFMIKKAKVGLNDGTMFGEGGRGFMRINFACPRSILIKGLESIEKAVKELK